MAKQFQPPYQLKQAPTKEEALLNPISQAISTLPEQWDAYKHRRILQQIALQEARAKYGTGAAPSMASGQIISTPLPNSGPEGDLYGTEISPPTNAVETPEQKLSRMGSEAYKTLNPPQYGSYMMGEDGQPRLIQFPAGVRPGPAIAAPTPILDASGRQVGTSSGKPTVLPSEPVDREEAKQKIKLETEKPKAIGSFNNTIREFDNMIAEANAIKDDASLPGATGALMGRVTAPGGPTRVASRLDTLKAKTLLNVLASMKDLSKTGSSGFGQLSEIEGENIRNSISSLNRKQSTQDFKDSLDRFIKEMEAKKQTLQETFANTYGEVPGQQQAGLPDVGSMFQGHKVLSVKRVK